MIRSCTSLSRPRRPAGAPAYLALNLSYVLHAPSMSPQVADFVRGNQRAARAIVDARDRFGGLGDAAFGRAIVSSPEAEIDQVDPTLPTLSVRLGAWELLPRALEVVTRARPRLLTLLDDSSPNLNPQELFRGMAQLNLPPDDAFPCRFATLIWRPGYRSLLLDAALVDSPAQLARQVEAAVRRYVDQWRCVRALWDEPAEAVLPELAGRS